MPTFVSENETTWNASTSPKSLTSALDLDDVLVAVFSEENYETGQTIMATDTRPIQNQWDTYPHELMANNATTHVGMSFLYPSPDIVPTLDVRITRAGGSAGVFGANLLRFANCLGVGSPQSDSSQQASFTTVYDNSAVVMIVSDWGARDVTSRVWGTPLGGVAPTEVTYFCDTARYTVAVAYTPDAGPSGLKSVGFTSSPFMGTPRMMTLEIYNKAIVVPPATGNLLTESGPPLFTETDGPIST